MSEPFEQMHCVARLREGVFGAEQLSVYVYDTRFGRHAGCEVMEMRDIPEGERMDETFRLANTEAQELMDSLWQCGVRPSEGTGSAGQLAAVQYHLEDMRKLVFEVKDER